MKLQTLLALVFLAGSVQLTSAGPLTEAKINQIVNDVKVVEPEGGARPAVLQDLIRDDRGVATGIQSRAELLFQDNTLTRLGAETFFSFQPGTRNLDLDRGTILLQVPKKLGGAQIRAASVSASITGTTIMMEHVPGSSLKILVLEGSLNVAIDSLPGQNVVLQAGKMVTMSPTAKELPKPVNVDLRKLVRTSALIDPVLFSGGTKTTVAALPSMKLIEKAIAQQSATVNKADLVAANMEVAAAGTGVASASGGTAAPADGASAQSGESGADQTQAATGSDAGTTSSTTTTASTTTPTDGSATTGTTAATPTTTASSNSASTPTTTTTAPSATQPASTAGPDTSSAPTTTTTQTNTPTTTGTGTASSPASSSPASPTTPANQTTNTPAATTPTTTTPVTSSTPPQNEATLPDSTTTPASTTTADTSSTTTTTTTTTTTSAPTTDTTSAPPDPFAPITATPPPTVDTSTWTLATTPYPWPDASAKATASTSKTAHALPTVIATPQGQPAYLIGTSTNITTGGATPLISGLAGTIYGGSAQDGPASAFLFGSSKDQDAQLNFDQRFGSNYSGTTPPNGIAVFEFQKLQFNGAPNVATAGGPVDLALIGQQSVTSGTTSFTWDLSNLRRVFIGSINGPVTLGNTVNFSSSANASLETLHLYGRGGNITLGGTYTLPAAKLVIDGTNGVTLSAGSAANVGQLIINGIGNVQLAGTTTSNYAQFWSNGQINITGAVSTGTLYTNSNQITLGTGGSITGQNLSFTTAGDFANGTAGTVVTASNELDVNSGGNFTLNTTGTNATRFDLTNTKTLHVAAKNLAVSNSIAMATGSTGILAAGSGGLNAHGVDLTNFQNITSGGNIQVQNLDTQYLTTTNGNAQVTGNLSVLNASVAGDLHVTGTISPRVGDAVTTLQVISAQSIEAAGGLNFKGADAGPLLPAPTDGGQLVLVATAHDLHFDTGAGAINGANFDGGSAAAANGVEGGNGGTLHVGTDTQPTGGQIVVNTAISASTGANGSGVAYGGKGGTVQMVASKTITVNSSIKVSDSTAGRASKQGGNIRLDSRATGGQAINVTSSGQLLSLLAAAAPGPGGTIQFVSAGGDIVVNGGKVQADRGTVDIRNNGPNGLVQLTNAAISGDVVKVGALGPNGQLNIGGGTINADTSLKLYGGTSNGQVHFTDNVTLGGASTKIIAGKTVTIDNGKVVTIGGNTAANVYTDNPNYTGFGGNGSKTGTFGGRGATTSAYKNAPSF